MNNPIWVGAASNEAKRIRAETKKEIAYLRRAMRETTDPEINRMIVQEIEEIKSRAVKELKDLNYRLY
jgi:hypothetical protein